MVNKYDVESYILLFIWLVLTMIGLAWAHDQAGSKGRCENVTRHWRTSAAGAADYELPNGENNEKHFKKIILIKLTTMPMLQVPRVSVETNLFFERIRISNLIRNPEFFRIRIRILFVVRKFSNPNPNIRDLCKKIRIRIRVWRNILIIQIIE